MSVEHGIYPKPQPVPPAPSVIRWVIEFDPATGAFGIAQHPTDPFLAFGMLDMAKLVLGRRLGHDKPEPRKVLTFPPGALPNIGA